MLQGRDCGDETDVLPARSALDPLQPVCPKCLNHVLRPFNVFDTAIHEVICRGTSWTPCGQVVRARFYREQV
jgi:hypothetical protein